MKRKVKRISGIFMAATMLLTSNVYGNANTGQPGARDTEIYAGVLVSRDSVQLNVEVPTRFAFVVRPNAAAGAAVPVVITPNAYVEPLTPGGALAESTQGGTDLKMINRSSRKAAGATNWSGLAVAVQGVIRNNGGTTFSYNPRLADATITTQPANTYGMILNSTSIPGGNVVHRFNAPSQVPRTAAQLDTPIALPAPPTVDPTTGDAITTTDVDLSLEVVVGGTNADYTRSAISSQVGTVSWKVTQNP